MGALAPGAVIGNCRIEGVVGQGGMGVVYRARQLDLDREVALKVVAPALTADPEARARFLAEARAAAAVDHPGVVPVHAAGEFDGAAYFVMRFVRGDDLRTLVRRDGRLPPDRAAVVTAGLGEALDAIHRAGYVHRDVKPQNVLLDEDGHVYLSDFGVAKALAATHGETVTDHWVGTLDYVAPEQIRGQRVDARADVYALGGVLHFMLTGSVPYPRATDEARLWAHLHDPPPQPSALAPEIPVAFDRVVASAMAKEPALRFSAAGELGRAARAAADGEAPTAVLPRAPRRRRRLRLWPATAVLALAAAAAVLLLPRSDHAASPQPPIVTPSPSPSPEPTPAPHRGETFDHFGERPRDVVVAGQRVWVISHGRQKVLTKDLVQTDRDSYFIGYGASDIAADANDDVWITREIGRQLLRLDGRTGRRELTVPTPGRPRLLVAGRSRVWVAMQEDRESPAELVPYDPATGTWGTALPFQDGIAALTYGAGSVWVTTNKPGELVRITPDGDPKHVTWFGDEGSDLAYGAGQVWASVPARDAVVHGLERGSYRSENVDGQPAGIAVWHGVIFVARESVDRVDGYRLRGRWKRVYKIPVADTPHALAVGGGHLWVACIGEGALERIDW